MRLPARRAAPEVLVLAAIASVQTGGALATHLFGTVGPAGAVLLRLGFAAVVLLAVARPSLAGPGRRGLLLAVAFGVVLAAMNFSFYLAIDRVPLGVAVTVEFVGPLAVAIGGSRTAVDLLWAALAAGGVVLLTTAGGGVAVSGVLLALVAGAFWAAYILVSKAVGKQYGGSSGLALALAVGTVLVLPFGLLRGGSGLGSASVLATGFGVAMLSSAIPYSLELAALRRIPARVFGVLMSLEPAMAAVAGFLVAGQALGMRAVAALVMVSAASLGSTLAHRRTAPAGEAVPSA